MLSSPSDPVREEEEEEEGRDAGVFFDAADFLLRTESEGGRVVRAVDTGLLPSSLALSLELSDSDSR